MPKRKQTYVEKIKVVKQFKYLGEIMCRNSTDKFAMKDRMRMIEQLEFSKNNIIKKRTSPYMPSNGSIWNGLKLI